MKPIIKVREGKGYLATWVVERFPQGYQNMTYLEPFLGGGSVLLAKEPSVEEVANDLDSGLMSVWRAVRDEPKLLVSKLRRVKYKETCFLRQKGKVYSDYINTAAGEFILRQMSKSGMKNIFIPKKKSNGKVHCWQCIFDKVPDEHERIKRTYLLNKDALDVIKAFSHENSLVYCDPPSLRDKEPEMDVNRHIELGEMLKSFKGKVVITAHNSATYKRLYDGWTRKGVPGRPKESAWMNF
jgi:DNA adenine methylase